MLLTVKINKLNNKFTYLVNVIAMRHMIAPTYCLETNSAASLVYRGSSSHSSKLEVQEMALTNKDSVNDWTIHL